MKDRHHSWQAVCTLSEILPSLFGVMESQRQDAELAVLGYRQSTTLVVLATTVALINESCVQEIEFLDRVDNASRSLPVYAKPSLWSRRTPVGQSVGLYRSGRADGAR